MKAVIYTKYGPPSVLQLVNLDKPVPLKNEVCIHIKATSVTNADCYMRRADTFFSRLMLGFCKPRKRYRLLGTEFSGVIEKVGDQVKAWKTGDEVYGFRGFGSGCYAEYKTMPANGSLSLKPTNMSFIESVSVVDGASTAFFFLNTKAHIKKGQQVLINGASGSIGSFAVQLAKYYGAHVTGVCSTKNIDLVKSLGADVVIDYTKTDFTRQHPTYDLVFDTIGKSSFAKCKNILTANGQYLTTAFTLKNLCKGIYTKWFSRKKLVVGMSVNKAEALRLLKELIENGEIKTIIDQTYTLEQMAEAHTYVEKGHKTGNVVITV